LTLTLVLATIPASLFAVGSYVTNGVEYAVAGALPGDQVHPALALNSSGGYLVWEDNRTDGDGLGVSARKLDSGFSGSLAPFRVNSIGTANQERPQVALLNGGGAVFVWQGGKPSFQHIYAHFLSANGTWVNVSDLMVNSSTTSYQMNPAVATLANGNVVVVWSSANQYSANSMQDIYGQVLSPSGQKIGSEFLVNQFTTYNQRSPGVAGLAGGGYVVTWISEQERNGSNDNPDPSHQYQLSTNVPAGPSVDVYARIYPSSGAVGGEFLVNDSFNPCANPTVAGGTDGGFMVSWGQKDLASIGTNSWDIFARSFTTAGSPGAVKRVNTTTYGDQLQPKISVSGTDYLVVWTSLAQDGSMEGIFGQFLAWDTTPEGTELQINTTWINRQIHPATSSDGAGHFLVAWSGFSSGNLSFDLFAQRYISDAHPLAAMDPPFLYVPFVLNNGTYQPQIQVSWAPQNGLAIDHYEVYVDGAAAPVAKLATNIWLMTQANGLTAGSTHSFQVAYVTSDLRRSPLSTAATAKTWNGLMNWGGIPSEWMSTYYGPDITSWPPVNSPVADDGPSLLNIFLSGGNPLDPTTWLRVKLQGTSQGLFLAWNPQPGLTYQVQTSTDLESWTNVGAPRFAAGSNDSLFVGGSPVSYYRILRLR
jgi:hypothetical protein